MTTIHGISVRGARSRTESASGARRSATICSQAGGPSEMAAAAALAASPRPCDPDRSDCDRSAATIAPRVAVARRPPIATPSPIIRKVTSAPAKRAVPEERCSAASSESATVRV